MVSFWPSATARSRIRLAEKSARIATPGAASGSSRARQNEPRKSSSETVVVDLVRRRAVDVAHAHFLRPQPDAHRGAVLEAVDARCRQSSIVPTRSRSGPVTSASRNVMVPTKSATNAVVGIAVDLGRRARPARSRPGSSPRCGRPSASASSWSCVTMMVVTPSRRCSDLDLVAQPHAHARIERGERLVEQQQAGRGRERARQRDALLLAAGQLHRIFGALLGQADQREQLRRRARRSRRARSRRLTRP